MSSLFFAISLSVFSLKIFIILIYESIFFDSITFLHNSLFLFTCTSSTKALTKSRCALIIFAINGKYFCMFIVCKYRWCYIFISKIKIIFKQYFFLIFLIILTLKHVKNDKL